MHDFAINGLSYKAVEKLNRLKTPTKSPSYGILNDISNKFEDVNMNWLISGKGEMLANSPNINFMKEDAPAYETSTAGEGVPLVTIEAAAGMGTEAFSIKDEDVLARYRVPVFDRMDFMIAIKGSSMYPKYSSGDIVGCRIIKESQFIQWNKAYVIATKEQGILCKRLKPTNTKNCYLAVSDNKDFDPFEIPVNEITGLAIVVGVIRVE